MSGRDEFRVPLGIDEQGGVVALDFGAAWHTALQGATRSGKSVTSMVALGRLSRSRRVVVAGLDPTGLLLGPWAEYPHPEWRACGPGAEFAAVADALVAEMDTRITALGFDSERGWRDKLEPEDFTEERPLIVVVLEEFPGLLALLKAADAREGRKAGAAHLGRVQAAVQRLVQEAAKVGIRVVLIAQRMEASIVSGAVRAQLGTRITHRVDNADSVRMLHADADAGLVERVRAFGPGRGFVEMPGEPARVFQAFYVSYAKYAETVASRAKERG